MRLLLLPSLLSFGAVAINYNKNDKCGYCHFLVATFEAGLRRTARHHFAGGDTAWEERKLGKYATSETRFIETMEDICRKSALKDSSTFNVLADLEVKCSFLVEENEEAIEEYYYKHQSSNMTTWLCESRLELCCPEGHYGKNCAKCPGLDKSGLVCYGHGKCDGEGSRTGSGKCKCDDGYAGNVCRQCAPDFFEKSKTNKSVECEKCDLACSGGCTGSGPEKCVRCRYGWNLTPGQGCVDINECETGGVCSKPNEKCINTPGSYECECVDGYKKEGSECVLDVEAKPYRMLIPPDTLLKAISMTSLAVIIAFVIWRRSILLLFLSGIAVALIIYIDINVNPETIPDDAKKYLGL
ncbi:Latent transforming growth factor beta binding protein 4 [Trichostrongylus colubriformis]|uniref:Latent transforming growth factor beta binding protein 4 n=1 Tax=Trichostrongylus colubriformis TaxID=6319 RepID=A0AAN8FH19_TRICO